MGWSKFVNLKIFYSQLLLLGESLFKVDDLTNQSSLYIFSVRFLFVKENNWAETVSKTMQKKYNQT